MMTMGSGIRTASNLVFWWRERALRWTCLWCLWITPSAVLCACLEPLQFTNHPIDVVIPSVEKDLPTLNLCIEGIRKNGRNIRRVIVVSQKPLSSQAEWFDESRYPFSLQEVAQILAKGDVRDLETLLAPGGRGGWYYQQLLKFYAPFVIPDISPNVLILDSDTIFLNPVQWLNENSGGMYNVGIEYHLPYFQHAACLIPGFRKIFPQHSGIVHHMLFQKGVIEQLFDEVEQVHGVPFWKAFCHLVGQEHLAGSGASEYEIYFNYVFAHTSQVSLRGLLWRNIDSMDEVEKFRKQGYHYVSYHSYARPQGSADALKF